MPRAAPYAPGSDRRGNTTDRARRRAAILARFGNGRRCPCAWCGVALTERRLTVDRIDPHGGYGRRNVIPACGVCNRSRGGKPVDVWLERCPQPDQARAAIQVAKETP